MMRRNAVIGWLLAVVAIVAVVWLTTSDQESEHPLSPLSTEPSGTRALVETLDRFAPTEGEDRFASSALDADVVILVTDRLNGSQRTEVSNWVKEGGRLIVADPSSLFAPGFVSTVPGRIPAGPECDVEGLTDLTVEARSVGMVEPPSGARRCFSANGGAFLTVEELEEGTIVSLASALPLTNEFLGDSDNAAVVGHMALEQDPARIVVLRSQPEGEPNGSPDLIGLIPSSTRWVAAELLVAVLVAMWAVGRRFGAVVVESQPVELPGSLGVRATAELHRRVGGHRAAAEKLQTSARRSVCLSIGLPVSTPPAEVGRVAQERFGLSSGLAGALVNEPQVNSAASLDDFAHQLVAVRHRVDESAGALS